MKLYAFIVTVLMVGWVLPAQAQDASKAGEDIGKKWVAAGPTKSSSTGCLGQFSGSRSAYIAN